MIKVRSSTIFFLSCIVVAIVISSFSVSAGNAHQKQYWIVTDGVIDKTENLYVLEQSFLGNPMLSKEIECVWYTDYYGTPNPISMYGKNGWAVSTKLEVWGETEGDVLIFNVKMYKTGNPNPETIQWRITNSGYPLKYTVCMVYLTTAARKTEELTIHPDAGISTLKLGLTDSITISMFMCWG